MRRLPCITLLVSILGFSATHAQSVSAGGVDFNLSGHVYGFADTSSGHDQQLGGLEALRLYPKFDTTSQNDIQFGMLADLREGAGSGANIRAGQFYTRRLYAHIGTRDLGTIRIGTTDGASAYDQVGTFDVGPAMFNDGGWNGIAHYMLTTAVNPAWPFASSRFYYATNKIVYLSPRVDNFNINLSYEPDVYGANINDGGHYRADSNSDFADAANITTNTPRRRNTLDGSARFARAFGDITTIATASYIVSGQTNSTNFQNIRYQGLNFGDIGASVSYAGITVAGNLQHGIFNGSWQLSPAGATRSTAYSLGISYKIAQYRLGVSYFNYHSPGDYAQAALPTSIPGERREQGISAGGSYQFSKNISLYIDYLFGQRDQTGYDFQTGLAGSALSNHMHSQTLALGGQVSW